MNDLPALPDTLATAAPALVGLLIAALLPNMDAVRRVIITPRGRSWGVTEFLPLHDRHNYPQDYLFNRMVVGLGGRVAEELACDQITAGAHSDLQGVTRVARAMVTQLGMADELGPEIFGGSGDSGLDGSPYAAWEPKEYSEDTARCIAAAVHRLISEVHQKACSLLGANRPALDPISEALLYEESLNPEQIVALMGAIPAGTASKCFSAGIVWRDATPAWCYHLTAVGRGKPCGPIMHECRTP